MKNKLVEPQRHGSLSTCGNGLSFQVMQREAILLIRQRCMQKGVRGYRDLSVRAGVDEKVALFVYPDEEGVVLACSNEPLPVNGRQWDEMFSAAGVSLQDWVEQSRQHSPAQIESDDLVTPVIPSLVTCSTGERPAPELDESINVVIGYSTAFFLKASNVVLPA